MKYLTRTCRIKHLTIEMMHFDSQHSFESVKITQMEPIKPQYAKYYHQAVSVWFAPPWICDFSNLDIEFLLTKILKVNSQVCHIELKRCTTLFINCWDEQIWNLVENAVNLSEYKWYLGMAYLGILWSKNIGGLSLGLWSWILSLDHFDREFSHFLFHL